MENLVILTGPTGIGKTELSLDLANKFNGEIISCDSMQIYKKLDIGTAKIDTSKTNIPHYMVDIINPWENFSVSDFQEKSKNLISDINNRGKLPFLVGGTGLYINSITYKLDFAKTEVNWEYRNKLNYILKNRGVDYLYNRLKELDSNAAEKIHKNNYQRIIRALEIIKEGNNKGHNFREENNEYNLCYIGLNMNRERLYERINRRVDIMISKGLVNEVQDILRSGVDKNSQSLKAIGYKEVISYIDKEITYDDMIELIKRNSRRYAKRQLTWFRADNRVKWFDRESDNLIKDIENYIGDRIEGI